MRFWSHRTALHQSMSQLCTADVAHMLLSHFVVSFLSEFVGTPFPLFKWTLERSLVTSFPRRQHSSVNNKTLTTGSAAHAPFSFTTAVTGALPPALCCFHSLFHCCFSPCCLFDLVLASQFSCLVLANIISPLGMLPDC